VAFVLFLSVRLESANTANSASHFAAGWLATT